MTLYPTSGYAARGLGVFFLVANSLRRVVIISPKIVKIFPGPMRSKGEPNRFSSQRYSLVHTDKQTSCYFIIRIKFVIPQVHTEYYQDLGWQPPHLLLAAAAAARVFAAEPFLWHASDEPFLWPESYLIKIEEIFPQFCTIFICFFFSACLSINQRLRSK